jgi:hypothetical protein
MIGYTQRQGGKRRILTDTSIDVSVQYTQDVLKRLTLHKLSLLNREEDKEKGCEEGKKKIELETNQKKSSNCVTFFCKTSTIQKLN